MDQSLRALALIQRVVLQGGQPPGGRDSAAPRHQPFSLLDQRLKVVGASSMPPRASCTSDNGACKATTTSRQAGTLSWCCPLATLAQRGYPAPFPIHAWLRAVSLFAMTCT